jgi:hypothetical protein
MERVEISDVNLVDVVKHVARDQVAVELADGQVPLAKLIPIGKKSSMSDLDRALRKNLPLVEGDQAFAQDVLSVRDSLEKLDDPWAS